MYYSNQILMHKETLKVVQLCGDKTSQWCWPRPDGVVALLDIESGETFGGLLTDYTHIQDEFGRPFNYDYPVKRKWDNREVTYEMYLKPPEELLELREKSYQLWKNWIINQLLCKGSLMCPFADGSYCVYVGERFLKEHKKKTLIKYWCGDHLRESIDSTFRLMGVKFYYSNDNIYRVMK